MPPVRAALHGFALTLMLGGAGLLVIGLLADDLPLVWACLALIAAGIAGVFCCIFLPAIDSGPIARAWKWFLALTRLDLDAVCELSAGLPEDADLHDWRDQGIRPWPGYRYTCRRCGKRFTI
jgi:hypothetical protein